MIYAMFFMSGAAFMFAVLSVWGSLKLSQQPTIPPAQLIEPQDLQK